MILGLCCVKDCERWFEEVIASHLRVCDHILVLDDGSTDRTGEIARSFDRVTCRHQDGLPRNEARDRNLLFGQARAFRPDWCWWFDGDETVWRADVSLLERAPAGVNCVLTPLLMMWGDDAHYAHDWSVEKKHLFRYIPAVCRDYRWAGRGPHRIHCGARPRTDAYQLPEHVMRTDRIVELHWGWMDRSLINKKLGCYRQWDPQFADATPYRRFERPPKDVRLLAAWSGDVGRPGV